MFHHSISDAKKIEEKETSLIPEVTYHLKTLTPNLPKIGYASMLDSQNLDFLQPWFKSAEYL